MQYLHVMGIPIPIEDTVFNAYHSPSRHFTGMLERFRCWLFIMKLKGIMHLERIHNRIRQLQRFHPNIADPTPEIFQKFRLKTAEADTLNYCLSQLFIPHVCRASGSGCPFLTTAPANPPLYCFSFRICPRCLRHSLEVDPILRSKLHRFQPELLAFTYPPSHVFTRIAPLCPAPVAFFYYGMIFPDFYFADLAKQFSTPLPATMTVLDHQAFFDWAYYYQVMDRNPVWLGPWWSSMTSFASDDLFKLRQKIHFKKAFKEPFHVFMKF